MMDNTNTDQTTTTPVDNVDSKTEVVSTPEPQPAPTEQPVPPVVIDKTTIEKVAPNFTIDDPDYTTVGYSKFTEDENIVSFPNGNSTEMQKVEVNNKVYLEKFKEDSYRELSDDQIRHVVSFASGSQTGFFNGVLDGTAKRPEAIWKQVIRSGINTSLRPHTPNFKPRADIEYTGKLLNVLVRRNAKLGTTFRVPLWHSGFWMLLRSASDIELIDLQTRISNEKINLGRRTFGMLFSNMSVVINSIMMDFILDHLEDSSLDLDINDKEAFKKLILLPDLTILIWGMACATWPNGFAYERACITDIKTCNYILKEKLNPSKVQFTDETALTPLQIQHMSKRESKSVKLTDLDIYRSSFIRGGEQVVKLDENISIVFSQTNVNKHVELGYDWVDGIYNMYTKAMTVDENQRNTFMEKQAQASTMCQYLHFVKSVILHQTFHDATGEEYVKDIEITNKDELKETLITLSARDDYVNVFYDKMIDFIDNSIVSFIAIPTFSCPKCGKDQRLNKDEQDAVASGNLKIKFPELIPIDPFQTFFQLMDQKVARIQLR